MMSLVTTMLLAGLSAQLQEQPPESQEVAKPKPSIKIGEVTGDNVYVRSGPSTNYYPVMRLPVGSRVVMVAKRPAWVGIAPPKGAFSLVARQYVDPDGENKGVINGDRVWVRAGSDLSTQRYAKQARLNKGAAVTLLGETDEYYKITPPKGATLWISDEFVRVVGEETAAAQPEDLPEPQPATQVTQAAPPAPSTEGIEVEGLQTLIELIEDDLELEFAKNTAQRDLPRFIERFKPIAEQDEDLAAKQYANYRTRQLTRVIQHEQSLKEMDEIAARIKEQRRNFLQSRSKIVPPSVRLEREFAVRGKFVKSAAYSSPVGLQRYRIVAPDSKETVPRTLAYVEIDPQSKIDPLAYLGRYVGVRARGRRLLEGSVDPVVVYTAAEIVVLEEVPEDEPQQ